MPNTLRGFMSQIPDSTENTPAEKDLSDRHISEICLSLQFHLPEPSDEVHQMRLRAVNRPDTPPQVLEHIASRGSVHLAKRVAEHPRAHPDTLSQLALHEHFEVRAALADNRTIPIDLQWQLARDEHPDVRFALAQSYHIEPDVLASLMDDENPFVVHRAKTTLQRKNNILSKTALHPGASESSRTTKRMRASG